MSEWIHGIIEATRASKDVANVIVEYADVDLLARAEAYFAAHPTVTIRCEHNESCKQAPVVFTMKKRQLHMAAIPQRARREWRVIIMSLPLFIDWWISIGTSYQYDPMCQVHICGKLIAKVRGYQT
jgi:hypothetical protein